MLLLVSAILISEAAKKPKYIFYFIGDGMGFASLALTQAATKARVDSVGFTPVTITDFPVVGYATTHAATRLVTCSAAAGTALATGSKTSIGTIGMNSDHTSDLKSIAVVASENGMRSGVATSVSIDHATPASFYAHVPKRSMSYKIGTQAITTGLDLYAGSGFLDTKGGEGDAELYSLFQNAGYTIVRGDQPITGNKAVLVQTANASAASLAYAIDRKEQSLTLSQITRRSIDFLASDPKQGFFLMVEGGQIDWAAHANDAATLIHEVVDFAEAIDQAVKFYDAHPEETLIVITADHETGGLAIGRDDRGYDTNLELLFNQKMSVDKLNAALEKCDSWDNARKLLQEKMGFWKAVKITPQEEKFLEAIYNKTSNQELQKRAAYDGKAYNIGSVAVSILAKKAGVGWTTGSHTGIFVPVFAKGVGSELFVGGQDNTDIANNIKALIVK